MERLRALQDELRAAWGMSKIDGPYVMRLSLEIMAIKRELVLMKEVR